MPDYPEQDYWISQLDKVLADIVKRFFSCPQQEARRVFHGRGQLYEGLEHLCIDWFAPVVLITAYQHIENLEVMRESITSADVCSQVSSIVIQKRFEKNAPSQLLQGAALEEVIVKENGLLFEVRPGLQQNAGLFLDMRLLREWLLENSQCRNVLNLFAYTCSLSVAALAGGARSVTNVDMSKTSMRWGERNHEHNNQDMRCVSSIPHNLFTSWGRIKQFGRYDLVIIDPPSRQRGSFDVEKNYPAVLKKLPQLCNPQAEVIATVNSPFLDADYLVALFAKHAPTSSYIDSISPAPEFADKYPQKGLKIYRFAMA